MKHEAEIKKRLQRKLESLRLVSADIAKQEKCMIGFLGKRDYRDIFCSFSDCLKAGMLIPSSDCYKKVDFFVAFIFFIETKMAS